ncbi:MULTISPECIES: hypothetical protein [unclassified Acinetobacter]|uniref:hypothetical protein n=1 Tax=unclassified Acinetobacter TaxID=196816 RepID=UPI002934F5C2|nr:MULTISPECIES: hypothetical protein [unclassified Acinetobacter]WOE32722.1 hypothetical protein QSG84_05960 [Acinetobacter sp. SAAs470]WOE38198.1 hypothetical protein QSG86_15015 [Acinetobacter sp. SAAs474]
MKKIELGNKVLLASVENMIFEVVGENPDGSFEIEVKLSDIQVLRYGNISKEMLQLIH